MRLKIAVAVLSVASALVGCANMDYQKQAVPSEITGFYAYTKSVFTTTSIQAVKLNPDGSGYSCNYSTGGNVNKVPIKHIGGGVWAMSTMGTAKITKNDDGSISWGEMTTYYPEKLENTKCE